MIYCDRICKKVMVSQAAAAAAMTPVMDQPAMEDPPVMEELPVTQSASATQQPPVMEEPEVMNVPPPITFLSSLHVRLA
jgi:hypothetical protein